jgi:hypothetical protein
MLFLKFSAENPIGFNFLSGEIIFGGFSAGKSVTNRLGG